MQRYIDSASIVPKLDDSLTEFAAFSGGEGQEFREERVAIRLYGDGAWELLERLS